MHFPECLICIFLRNIMIVYNWNCEAMLSLVLANPVCIEGFVKFLGLTKFNSKGGIDKENTISVNEDYYQYAFKNDTWF